MLDTLPPTKERTAARQDTTRAAYATAPYDVATQEPLPYRLHLKAGDVLILEETRGCATGSGADADPQHRHVVRLTRAMPTEDPLTGALIWEIEWHQDDALPFDLRLSVRMPAPDCEWRPSAVARGNVMLVDHGVTVDIEENDAWSVEVDTEALRCVCDGAGTQLHTTPKPLAIELATRPLTSADPLPRGIVSARALTQRRDVRAAVPSVTLDVATPKQVAPAKPAEAKGGTQSAAPSRTTTADPEYVMESAGPAREGGVETTETPVDAPREPEPEWAGRFEWLAARDLLASGPYDKHFAVEIDDEGFSHLRFGDGLNGQRPASGWRFRARYRVGNGLAGNVGRDAIVWLARKSTTTNATTLKPRNPLPASGGVAPESIEHVKRDAPHAFGRTLERAVAAADYAQLAADDQRVQGAFAELTWTGSWFEAAVALDPIARYTDADVESDVLGRLERARRIGHDLRLVPMTRVPLDVGIAVCVEPGHLRGDVERSVRAVLSSRVLPDGSLGMFHPDEWRFGADVVSSRLIAAVQAIDGVAHVEMTRFARMDASQADADRSRLDNVITIAANEMAILDADANVSERGCLTLTMVGGR